MTDPQNSQYPGNPYGQETSQFPPNPQFQPGPEPKQKKPFYKRGWFIAVAVVFGLVVVGTAIGGGEESSTTASDAKDTTIVEEASIDEIAEAPSAVEREEAPETTTEDVPVEYRNALTKAESYHNRMNMSEARVYDQLTSEYGEGFSPEAAQYAIDNLDADYNRAALEKAKSYQEGQAMSRDRVYDQLVSEYGENFTPEQAQYAVDNLPQ